jgi:hypothetical protein
MNRFGPRRKTVALVVAGIAGTGLLATGVASAATSATSSPASSSTADISTASLSIDGSTPDSTAAKGKLAAALKEIRQELKGGTVNGEVTVDTKKGPQTIEFQRGVVAQSSTASFTVTDSTGATDNWTVGPKLKVRDRGARRLAAGTSPASATFTDGETVIVVGLKTDPTSIARLVVVLPHAGAGKKPSTAPNSTSPTALQS